MSPAPDVNEVAWQTTGDKEDGVDADRITGPGKAGAQALGGGRDPTQTIFVERHRGGVLAGALLDLDERKGAPAPGDKVDLASGNPRAARDDAPAVQPEPPRCDRLRAATAGFGGLTFQSPAPSSSARA